MNKPSIAVIMSVYNDANYLPVSIESILNQNFKDFEFIIVNDGSSDNSEEVIQSYGDERILYLKNDQNIYLAASLNKGIKASRARYIARMDADDIADPDRLQKQFDFLEQNKDVGLCGSSWVNYGYKTDTVNLPEHDTDIKRELLHNCCVLHPSIMFRRSLVEEYGLWYDESFKKNQDYELYSRMVKYTKFYNFPDLLMKYHQIQANEKRLTGAQKQNDTVIRQAFFKLVDTDVNERELDLYKQFYYQNYQFCFDDFNLLDNLLTRMFNGVQRTNYLTENQFSPFIRERWYAFVKELIKTKKIKSTEAFKLSTSKFFTFTLKEKLKLTLSTIKS